MLELLGLRSGLFYFHLISVRLRRTICTHLLSCLRKKIPFQLIPIDTNSCVVVLLILSRSPSRRTTFVRKIT